MTCEVDSVRTCTAERYQELLDMSIMRCLYYMQLHNLRLFDIDTSLLRQEYVIQPPPPRHCRINSTGDYKL